MIRRFNYTGREKIKREHVLIALQKGDPHDVFDLQCNFTSYELPPDARVYVEAERKTRYMRFEWGTVSSPLPPRDRTLTAFDNSDSVKFRVKVTGTGNDLGKLLAAAHNLRPHEPENRDATRKALLPVKSERLNGPIWRVDFSGDEVILLIDEKINKEQVTVDPAFAAAVYPSVVREILQRIYIEGFIGEFENAEEMDWEAKWLKFAVYDLNADRPALKYEDPSDREYYFDWVEDVVCLFSRKHELLSVSLSTWNGEDS